MKKMPLLFAALLTLLVTCSPPPFDLGISESAKTARMLTFVGQVPIDPNSINLGGSQGNEDVVFIPEKDGVGGITIQAGFIYSLDQASGQQVSFVAYDGSQGRYVRYGSTQQIGPLSSDPFPSTMLQSVKSLHSGVAFQFNDSDPGNPANGNSYTIATGNPGTNSFDAVPASQTMLTAAVATVLGGSPKDVIGVSIYPDPSTTFDRTYWLLRRQTPAPLSSRYREARFDIPQIPIAAGSLVRAGGYDISSFIEPTGRVLYFYDPLANRSYVSVWNSPMSPGAWSTWVWIDAVPTYWQLTRIDNRIDDLLTTGELFSTEGNVGRVFDPMTPTGTLEATFPLSDLRFVGEVYIGGTATMLFSQALWAGKQLSFNIYSIPTSNLKSLAQ
jgi:hypothetical protein